MRIVRGTGIALGLFLASFALHIVGGATGQGWLFAIAVALIFVFATAFPVVAIIAGGFHDLAAVDARITAAIGAVAGYGFTVAALWAANGRAFAWWEFPLAAGLVIAGSAMALIARALAGLQSSRPAPARG